jgi:hypothetical protein
VAAQLEASQGGLSSMENPFHFHKDARNKLYVSQINCIFKTLLAVNVWFAVRPLVTDRAFSPEWVHSGFISDIALHINISLSVSVYITFQNLTINDVLVDHSSISCMVYMLKLLQLRIEKNCISDGLMFLLTSLQLGQVMQVLLEVKTQITSPLSFAFGNQNGNIF